MEKKLILFLFSSVLILNANMAPEGFERFPNYYFVETGTYGGEGIVLAQRAGFAEIYSVEIDEHFFAQAQKRFAQDKNVHLYKGDSAKVLWDVIKDLDKPITFWLDGHSGVANPDAKNCPVLEELEQIGRHTIKNHTIVIDDMHCAGTLLFDNITKDQIKEAIFKINPTYEITFVAGGGEGEYPENIMVARIAS